MNPGSDRPTILLSESKHVSENMWVVYENLCTKTREAAAAAGILTSGVTEVITGAAFKPGPKHPCQQHNPLLDSRWFSTCPERQGGINTASDYVTSLEKWARPAKNISHGGTQSAAKLTCAAVSYLS